MLKVEHVAIACFAALQSLSFAGLPVSAAQNCGPNRHWVQTGAGYGSGYCKPKNRRDHQVCAIGYHYEGRGVCKRNGDWWKGRRPINWVLAMNLRNQKVASHSKVLTVERFE